MDTELARKLLGVDGSNLLMLETAWHHQRTQILEQQAQSSDPAEVAEQQALLDNLDLARAVLKRAAEQSIREHTVSDRPSFQLHLKDTWRGALIGVAAGTAIALALLVLIVWLAAHTGS